MIRREKFRHYVYELVDPRDGATFYIGKGQNSRMRQHERDALSGRITNEAKHARISDIHAAGLNVTAREVARFSDEQQAFRFEREMIAAHRGLTNILAGSDWSLTEEESERRRNERLAIERKRKLRADQSWLRNWVKWVDSWPNGGTFPNIKDGDRKAAEFLSSVRELIAQPI